MFDEVYGYTKVRACSAESAKIPFELPDKTKTIQDYNVTMAIETAIAGCEVISGLPVVSLEPVVSNGIVSKLRGEYFVVLTIEDSATGAKTVDKTILVVVR